MGRSRITARAAASKEDGRFHLRYDLAIGGTMRVGARDPEFSVGPNFLSDVDLWSTWAEVRRPTLVLRGAESDFLPGDAMLQMQGFRPGVEVLDLPGVGPAPALMSEDQIEMVRVFRLG